MTQTHTNNTYVNARILRINVGYLLAASPGFNRTTSLDVPRRLRLAADTIVEKLVGDIRLTRTSEGILVQSTLECSVQEQCSRCLSDVLLTFPLQFEELFTITPQSTAEFSVGEDNMLDLAPLVREECLISIPSQIYCQPDCKGLCPACGQNLNEAQCDCALNTVDLRWAALAELKNVLHQDES